MRTFTTRDKIISLSGAILLVLVWKAVSLLTGSRLLLPPPEEAFVSMIKLAFSADFAVAVFGTVIRGIMGFLISLALGMVIGVLAGLNRTVNSLVTPLLVAVRSAPVISVILLALVWFRTDFVPVFIGLLVMFPIITTNIIEGIKSVDRELVDMARSYRVKLPRIILEVYIPAIVPFITGGIASAAGIGWKAIIASEVLSQPRYGIGTRMQNAQSYLLVEEVIAWTIIAVILSYIFENMIRFIERKIVVWR
ncbi:MAG: ABC transporter permease [Firmicutes bacterium HGW-Firmicutes-14]|jgi:NitT/TauT family transport system permease protein|nr:MAG: ABC transporter permease [Firmicutes bacterium HGW-Firmicutes-14]